MDMKLSRFWFTKCNCNIFTLHVIDARPDGNCKRTVSYEFTVKFIRDTLAPWKGILKSPYLLKIIKQAVGLVIGVLTAMAHNSNFCKTSIHIDICYICWILWSWTEFETNSIQRFSCYWYTYRTKHFNGIKNILLRDVSLFIPFIYLLQFMCKNISKMKLNRYISKRIKIIHKERRVDGYKIMTWFSLLMASVIG